MADIVKFDNGKYGVRKQKVGLLDLLFNRKPRYVFLAASKAERHKDTWFTRDDVLPETTEFNSYLEAVFRYEQSNTPKQIIIPHQGDVIEELEE